MSRYPFAVVQPLSSYWLFEVQETSDNPWPIEVAPADEGTPILHANLDLRRVDDRGFLDLLDAEEALLGWGRVGTQVENVTVREVGYPIYDAFDNLVGYIENRIMSVTSSMIAAFSTSPEWPNLLKSDGWLHVSTRTPEQVSSMVYPNPLLAGGQPSEYTVAIAVPTSIQYDGPDPIASELVTLPILRVYDDGTEVDDGSIQGRRWIIAPSGGSGFSYEAPVTLSMIASTLANRGPAGPSYMWFPENYDDDEYDPEVDGEPELRQAFDPWPGSSPSLRVPSRTASVVNAIFATPAANDNRFDVGYGMVAIGYEGINYPGDWNESNQPYFTDYGADGPFVVEPAGNELVHTHFGATIRAAPPSATPLPESPLATVPVAPTGVIGQLRYWTSGMRLSVTALVDDDGSMHDWRSISGVADDAVTAWLASGDGLMYEGELGTLPRPWSEVTGTFLGRSVEADGPYALDVIRTADGPLAVLVQGGRILVWREGALLWDEAIADTLPADLLSEIDPAGTPIAGYRFALPGWPHPTGAVQLGAELLAFQLRVPGDLRYEGVAGRPPVLFTLINVEAEG